MTFDKVAVIPSIGIGDGLIMMVASHRLYSFGYNVDTYSNSLRSLSDWFQGHSIKNKPSFDKLAETFAQYDLVILQNDNSPFAKAIIKLFREKKIKTLSVFYPSYESEKHGPLTPLDRVFNDEKPIVDNTAQAISSILGLTNISKNNGLTPPVQLTHRLNKHRVLIHPTSTTKHRTWHLNKFIKVASTLSKQGFYPVFCVSPSERSIIRSELSDQFLMPHFDCLSDLALYAFESGALIGNESGTSHLCSNLHLPTLVVTGCHKRIRLWRPGWYKGDVVTPPRWIPNLKGSRIRENRWQSCIFPSQVLKKFHNLIL